MLVHQINKNNYSFKNYKSTQDGRLDTKPFVNQKISFAQSNALKNCYSIDSISFQSRASYIPEDIKIIQKLLDNCRYGKRELISGKGPAPRKIKTESGLAIENFYTNDDRPDGLITGICEELTYKVGKRLEKLFGDKYILFGVQGRNSEFSGHAHLGLIHNTAESKALLTNAKSTFGDILKDYTEFTDSPNYKFMKEQIDFAGNDSAKIMQIYNSAQGLKLRQDHEFLESEAKRRKADFAANNLTNSLMIDPSYNRIDIYGYKNGSKRPTTYMGKPTNTIDEIIIEKITPIDESDAIPANPKPIGDRNLAVPIGRLGYLFNKDKIAPSEKDKLLCLCTHGNLIIPLPMTKGWNYGMLDDKHPFVEFMTRLNQNSNI